MPSEVLHTQDHKRYGTRAFLRLELTDDAVIVVVHELGSPHVRDDSQQSRDAWHSWQEQLEPPTLTDDLGTTYAPSREVSWHLLPPPRPQARRWTIDGRWTVERFPA